jgi:uncharacterized protein (DUF2225 family)
MTQPDTCKCPLCGSEVKSEIVKRLRATGISVTAADMEIIQRFEELQSRVFTLEQRISNQENVNPLIGSS